MDPFFTPAAYKPPSLPSAPGTGLPDFFAPSSSAAPSTAALDPFSFMQPASTPTPGPASSFDFPGLPSAQPWTNPPPSKPSASPFGWDDFSFAPSSTAPSASSSSLFPTQATSSTPFNTQPKPSPSDSDWDTFGFPSSPTPKPQPASQAASFAPKAAPKAPQASIDDDWAKFDDPLPSKPTPKPSGPTAHQASAPPKASNDLDLFGGLFVSPSEPSKPSAPQGNLSGSSPFDAFPRPTPPPSTKAPQPSADLSALGSFLEADAKKDQEPQKQHPKRPEDLPKRTEDPTPSHPPGNTHGAPPTSSNKPTAMGSKDAGKQQQQHQDAGLFDMVKGAIGAMNLSSPFNAGASPVKPGNGASSGTAQSNPIPSSAIVVLEPDWTKECLIQNLLDNPKDEGGVLQKNFSFRVCSRTKLSHYNEEVFAVRRSINDFEYFRIQLLQEMPYYLVPLVPERKGAFEDMLGSEEGVTSLMKQYQSFLVKITRHPGLVKSQALKSFLVESAEEYRDKRKADETKQNLGSSLFNLSASTPKDPVLVKLLSALQDLERQLKAVSEIAQRMKIKHKELAEEYDKWTKEMSKIATSGLKNGVSEYQVETRLYQKLQYFTAALTGTAKSISAQSITTESGLYYVFKDWIRYTKGAQQLLERHTAIAAEVQAALLEMNKKKTTLDNLQATTRSGLAASDRAKIDKAQKDAIQAQEDYERVRDHQERLQGEFWNEMVRFDRFRFLELNHWMDYYGMAQVTELGVLGRTWGNFSK